MVMYIDLPFSKVRRCMNASPEQYALAKKWLAYAEGDLQSAKVLSAGTGVPERNVCYLAQQCAEKSLKALLIFWGIEISRTHDLDALLRKFPAEQREKFTEFDLSWLSEWNVEGRYPGDWPEATTDDARQAVELAEAIHKRAASVMASRGRA